MKKAILFLLALILLSAVTNAQKSFEENTKVVNAGVGLGYFNYGWGRSNSYRYFRIPYLSVSYEQAYKRLGPGTLGVGALLSYQSTRVRSNYYVGTNANQYFQHRYASYAVAARAVYHWDELNFENWEVYGGFLGGLRFQTYAYESNLPELYYNDFRAETGLSVRTVASLFVGARYYFTSNIGAFVELSGGWGVPYNTIGLSFKL